MLLADVGTGQILWFAMFVIWLVLVIFVISEIFMSADLSGGAKFLWAVVVVIAPFVGVVAYLVIRGGKISERRAKARTDTTVAADAYRRQAADHDAPTADGELARLEDLRANGVISDEEFEARKAQLLGP